METKHCDILRANDQYICHQCNCVSHGSAGLAAAIFAKHSYADCYSTRFEPDVPGTINVAKGYEPIDPIIINMFGQLFPGGPSEKEINGFGDTEAHRKKYFLDCLRAIKKLNPKSLAIPNKISCGLALGSWAWYSAALIKFEESTKIPITIYIKDE